MKEYKCRIVNSDILIVDSDPDGTDVSFQVVRDSEISTAVVLPRKEVKKLVKQLKKFLKEIA